MSLTPEKNSKDTPNELKAIKFSELIGGPLEACVKAQKHALKTTSGFNKDFSDLSSTPSITSDNSNPVNPSK